MKYTYENWNKIIEKYKRGEIDIGVNLPMARVFLMNNSTKFSIWALVILIFLPLIVSTSAISIYRWWGILFIIGFVITYISMLGLASYNFSVTSTCILSLGIFTVILMLLTSFIFVVPWLLSIITFLMIYWFYMNIGETIINDYAFHDYAMFAYLIENKVIIIKN